MEEIKNNSIKNDSKNKYYCYIIRSTNHIYPNLTYNGFTNNLTRRLRQHNGEITGGAKATKGKGTWVYLAIWDGFYSKNEALSCEWRIKHPTNSRIRPSKYNGIIGRIKSLNLLINLDCWTGKSTGMECGNQYNLYINEEFIGLIDFTNKKSNLEIKTLDKLILFSN